MISEMLGSGRKRMLLSKSLDAYMARSRAISSNIANATTPGYQRREVKFEENLGKALSKSNIDGTRTNSKHIALGSSSLSALKHEVVRPYDPVLASGVNNVDIDKEMADLAENQIAFKFAMKRLSGSFAKLNAAISLKSLQK